MQLAASRTGTLVAASRVDAPKFAAPPVDAAFINICREEGTSDARGAAGPPALTPITALPQGCDFRDGRTHAHGGHALKVLRGTAHAGRAHPGPMVGWGAVGHQTELTWKHLAAKFKRQLLGSPGPSPHGRDSLSLPKMRGQSSRSGTKQRQRWREDRVCSPDTPSYLTASSWERQWEPAPWGSHQEHPGDCAGSLWLHISAAQGRLAGQHQSAPAHAVIFPGQRHRCCDKLQQPPPERVSLHPCILGHCTPLPLGAICLVKLKSTPFDVPLPSSLPKTLGISPSLPLQTRRKLFLSLCLKLQTPVSGCKPPPSLASAQGM